MTRCQAFYEKWEKDPNFCDKSLSTVKRIDHYLDLVHEIEEAGADAGAIYRKFSEGSAREILNLKVTPEVRKSIVDNAAGLIIRGEKVTPSDIRAWSGVTNLPIGTKSTPDNGVKTSKPIIQDEDGYVETSPIEPIKQPSTPVIIPKDSPKPVIIPTIPALKPVIIPAADPVKPKHERMEELAEELLALYAPTFQTTVMDIVRAHSTPTSKYGVKDAFYYGIQALAERKQK